MNDDETMTHTMHCYFVRSTTLFDMYIGPELVLEATTRETNGDV